MHTATNKWGICIHVGGIVCWALGHCTRCTHRSWATMDTWRITFSNQTSKTEKITRRNWLDSRVTEGGSRRIFGPDTCSFQCHFGVRAHSWHMEAPYLQNVAWKAACHSDDWLQTYCKQQAFLQGIWVPDPCPCGGNFGGETTGGTTWLSTRQKIGRTLADSEPSTG